jgi:hypothetical protein
VGSDPILRFLALLEPVDEALVPEVRAEHAARAAAQLADPRPAPARPSVPGEERPPVARSAP